MLFNIYSIEFLYLVKDTETYNYPADTIIFAHGSDLCSILESLEGDTALLSLWLENNYVEANEDRRYLLVFGE